MATVCRMLLVLAVTDSAHLLFSLLSFSLPALSPAYRHTLLPAWLPLTLPAAQVRLSCRPACTAL